MAFNRRFFLKSAAASLALPYLPSIARAAGVSSAPRRVVFVVSANGQYMRNWIPSFQADTVHASGTWYKDLTQVAGPVSRIIGSQFDDIKSKISVLHGLDILGVGGHNVSVPLTGSSTTGSVYSPPVFPYSIDTVLGQSNAVYPNGSPIPVWRANPRAYPIGGSGDEARWSWDVAGIDPYILPYTWDANVFFQSAFSDFSLDDTELAKRRSTKSLIIDRVFPQYQSLKASSRLSSVDRDRLESYSARLRDVQTSLLAAPTEGCQVPTLQSGGVPVKTAYSNHIDMIVSALSCDITRVAVINVNHVNDNPDQLPTHDAWHQSSHDFARPRGPDTSEEYNGWIADRVSELVHKMDSVIDVDGNTLLDNSVVVWNNEIAFGEGHYVWGLPVFTAGSCGGCLETGKYIDYRQRPFSTVWENDLGTWHYGTAYNQFLISLFNAMGVPPAQYERAGQQGFGGYQQPTNHAGRYDQFISSPRASLPMFDKTT